MLNIRKIAGLLSLSTCLLLSNSELVRSQDITFSKLPIVKSSGTYTFALKSCNWSEDNIICKIYFVNNTRHSKYVFSTNNETIELMSKRNSLPGSYIIKLGDLGICNLRGCVGESPELDRGKTYEMTLIIPHAPDDTAGIRQINFPFYERDQSKTPFATFNDIFISSSINTATTTTQYNEPSVSSKETTTDICLNNEHQIIKAETKNFDLYICGDNRPTHYVGKAKRDGSSIRLPLSSQGRSKFIAKNANISYVLTSEFLTVTENGMMIQKEAVSNWVYLDR